MSMRKSRGLLEGSRSSGGRSSSRSSRFSLGFSLAANFLLALYVLFLQGRNISQAANERDDQMVSEMQGAVGELANTTAVMERTVKALTAASDENEQLRAELARVQKARVAAEAAAARAGSHRAAALPRPGAGGGKANYLFLGIPTVPRRNNVDYLSTTLETLLDQLPSDPADPFTNKIRAVVMNNKPGEHTVFADVKGKFAARAESKAALVEFMDNPGLIPDPAPHLPDPDDLNNPTNRPGHEVRKQTCDLITLMEMGANSSEYYMFMEDDFRVCPHFVRASHYVIDKANLQHPRWLAIRVSYGMNGIVMKSADVLKLAAYLREHTARLPPDLLWQEWASDKRRNPDLDGRPLLVYKQNLLDHIGTVSSFAVRPNRPKWPGCYESMASVWSLSRVEQFDRRCSADDMSPCDNKAGGGPDWLERQIKFG